MKMLRNTVRCLVATMAALVDPSERKDRARSLWRQFGWRGRLATEEIVQAAANAAIFGVCRAPEVDGASEREWMPGVWRWWEACAEEGWISARQADEGIEMLARKVKINLIPAG